jgi:hypothetical protein
MSALPHASDWQAGFLNILPAVQTHAKIQFRRLPAEQREEAIQEAVTSACVSYQRLAARNRLHVAHPGTLATFAVNFVRNGRHVGGRQDAAQDVLSPVARRRHGVRTVSLDHKRGQGGTDGWRQIAIEGRNVSIPDLAAFRIDYRDWLATLSRRDRLIIAAFVGGEGTFEVADRFGISPGRVSQLRHRYQDLWSLFQSERPLAA